MIDREKIPMITSMVRECEDYRDSLSTDRTRATEYYDGIMKDTPADQGRSSVVSRDVRSTIKDVLPSILRTILGNDEVVEYQPVGEGDEEKAAQASDYINYVVFPESGGPDAVHDAVHDALRLRNGVLEWRYEEKADVKVSSHTGIPEMALAELVADEDVEVLEQSTREEVIETPEGSMPVPVYDLKIRRKITNRQAKLECVPLEEFLIHPDAVDVINAPVVGRARELTRSDLVAMGYDKDKVFDLPTGEDDDEAEYEETTRRGKDWIDEDGEQDPSMKTVMYYELYVRVDLDGDGIAELRKFCFGGKVNERGWLHDEESDEAPYAIVRCERKPHQWEGVSISDDVFDIQRIKTVLLRATLDNIYWQNNPQPVVEEGSISDMSAVLNPEFGKPILVKQGRSAKDAYSIQNVPFVAEQSFGMLNYLDEEKRNRTGISDASSGMAQDALQNMTAKASAMIEASGIGQTEMIVSTIANDLKAAFRGLLRLIIRHQDAPRTVRLRDEWVAFDPRDWNAAMDCTVNTGLGAGTRERDMMMMQQVIGVQEKLLAGFGPDNPFVKPDNVYNAIAKLMEAAGLRTPSLYVTEPDEQEVAQKLEAIRNRPNPEQTKLEGQMALEKAKMEASTQKERAQMEADLNVKQAEIAANTQAQSEKLQADAIREEQKAALEREKMALDRELKVMEFDFKREIERMKLENDLLKASAAEFSRSMAKPQPNEAAQ